MWLRLYPWLVGIVGGIGEAYTALEVWAAANPLAAILGIPTAMMWIKDFCQDKINEVDNTTGFADKRASWMAWFDYQHNANSQTAEFLGYYIADKLNSKMGFVKGDAFYMETVPVASIINYMTVSIGHDIQKGGGLVLSGQAIQGLRTGTISSVGFAAKGKSSVEQYNWLAQQTAAANRAMSMLSAKAAMKRLQNRVRQANYRKTHKRRSTWVAK
jgi:hypothetical protein